jgi:hypothetical protein
MDLLLLAIVVIIIRDNVEVDKSDTIYHKYEYSPLCIYKDFATNIVKTPNLMFCELHNVLPWVNHGSLATFEFIMNHLESIICCFKEATHRIK